MVTVILIVIGALGTVTKGLLKGLEDLEIRGQVETILTTVLLRSTRILRRVLETWEYPHSSVALYGFPAKMKDDSVVCFGAKPDKGFLDLKSRRIRKW